MYHVKTINRAARLPAGRKLFRYLFTLPGNTRKGQLVRSVSCSGSHSQISLFQMKLQKSLASSTRFVPVSKENKGAHPEGIEPSLAVLETTFCPSDRCIQRRHRGSNPDSGCAACHISSVEGYQLPLYVCIRGIGGNRTLTFRVATGRLSRLATMPYMGSPDKGGERCAMDSNPDILSGWRFLRPLLSRLSQYSKNKGTHLSIERCMPRFLKYFLYFPRNSPAIITFLSI